MDDPPGDPLDRHDQKPSLFPLFPAAAAGAGTSTAPNSATISAPQWLCNPSFISDLSLINDAVSSLPRPLNVEEEDEVEDEEEEALLQQQKNNQSYELLEEEEDEDDEDSYSDGEKYEDRKKKKKKKKKKRD